VQQILVIRGGAIGDMIVTLPVLRALRHSFPEASIALLSAPPRAMFAQHAQTIDRLLDPDHWGLYRLFSQPPTLSEASAAFLNTCTLIVAYTPDTAALLQAHLQHYCPGEVLLWPAHPPAQIHITEHLLEPLRGRLRQPVDPCPQVPIDAAAAVSAAQFWQTAGLPDQGVVAFHPGSGGTSKLWPMTGWQQVIAWAVQHQIPGMLVSGPAEQEREPLLVPPTWPRARNLPLPHLAALLARCQVVVSHDSGIAHLAAAVGTTTLALFGPTNPYTWGPRSARTCVLWPQPAGPLTLRSLPPAVVIRTLAALLENTFSYTPSRVTCTILQPAGEA